MNVINHEIITQPDDTIFVLDIGTRSIIGLVGNVEADKFKVTAIESAEHAKRAMIDGQIEDIGAVARLASLVKERIEAKLGMTLTRVCVAAAGRALKTERTTHEIDIPEGKAIDDDLINQLESGAIEKIEEALSETSGDAYRYFHLVGYSAVQYYLDDYPISSLIDHHGSKMKADVLATFLPSEVVDSLYAAMEQAGLEVASLTLEPIAAINAAIPQNLRLLNLAFADIGAGTSDIAVCKDGNIIGYTMTTIAGDEITEALMREYLIDFDTAEQIKIDLESKKEIYFTDIMGFEQTVASEVIQECIADSISHLCDEIARCITDVNGGAPSAVFLAGGGSKLKGVLEGVKAALNMDDKRIAIAGNNFKVTSFSKEYDLNTPELATPLGIAVSTGLNLINDSYHLTLNGKRARLFRNGELNILNVLTMNGYQYRDLFGRSGSSMIITVNGKRSVLYGEPATNAVLTLNGMPATASDVVQAGDTLEFIPAKAGQPAEATVADVVTELEDNFIITINGELAALDTQLKSGDVIMTGKAEDLLPTESAQEESKPQQESEPEPVEEAPKPEPPKAEPPKPEPPKPRQKVKPAQKQRPAAPKQAAIPKSEPESKPAPAVKPAKKAAPAPQLEPTPAPQPAPVTEPAPATPFVPPRKKRQPMTVLDHPPRSEDDSAKSGTPVPSLNQIPDGDNAAPAVRTTWHFNLNDKPVTFAAKPDNSPYLLLDMLQHSGLDFDHLTSPVILAVNGQPGTFQQELKENDRIIIRQDG